MCSDDTHYLIRRIAGLFVLASLALGYWVNPWFFFVTAFVGLNLFQSSFTRICPMEGWIGKMCGGGAGVEG